MISRTRRLQESDDADDDLVEQLSIKKTTTKISGDCLELIQVSHLSEDLRRFTSLLLGLTDWSLGRRDDTGLRVLSIILRFHS